MTVWLRPIAMYRLASSEHSKSCWMAIGRHGRRCFGVVVESGADIWERLARRDVVLEASPWAQACSASVGLVSEGASASTGCACPAATPLVAARGDSETWALGLPVEELAVAARTTARAGIRDPFFWRALRLRARVLVTHLGISDIATLLSCCAQVSLSDTPFLQSMCCQLEVLLCGYVARHRPSDLVVACNSLLRLGLDPSGYRAAIFYDRLLTALSLEASRLSPRNSALLASCLARLGLFDGVLLSRAARRVLHAGAGNAEADRGGGQGAEFSRQCAMTFVALVRLRSRQRGERALQVEPLYEELEGLEAELAKRLLEGSLLGLQKVDTATHRRTLIETLTAERKRRKMNIAAEGSNAPTSSLAFATFITEQLTSLRRVAGQPLELFRVADACRGFSGVGFTRFLGFRGLQELSAWAEGARPSWPPVDASKFVTLLGSFMRPVCDLQDVGAPIPPRVPSVLVESVLRRLGIFAPALTIHALLDAVDICAMTSAAFPSVEARLPIQQQVARNQKGRRHQKRRAGVDAKASTMLVAKVLCSQLHSRSQEVSLKKLPFALAALNQLLTSEDLVPMIRRVCGQIAMDLDDAMALAAKRGVRCDQNSILDADGMGNLLYVMAACGYKDEGFLRTSQEWLLMYNAELLHTVKRDVSLVHVLHSLASLGVAQGDLIDAVTFVLERRIGSLDSFELLGVFDAAAILKEQAEVSLAEGSLVANPGGLHHGVLRAALQRLDALLPRLSEEEILSFAHMSRLVEIPEGVEHVKAAVEAAASPLKNSADPRC